jgi:hypothetical protein
MAGDPGKSRWQWNSRVKGLPRIGFLAKFTPWSSATASSSTFPSRTVEWLIYHSTVYRLESESSVDITADAVPEPNRFSPVA